MRRAIIALFALFVVFLPISAMAVVVQIDGTVVPLGSGSSCPAAHVRCCFEVYDPGGIIDPIIDARVYPGIFQIPCPSGCERSECGVVAGCEYNDVYFEVLGEGAGYHNSFGWYNVGDDVTTVSNLNLVLNCRSGGPIVCPDPDPRTAVIDFQSEFEVGNYDGGFIGMWLRTEELLAGGRDSDDCGSVGDTLNRIYYTEQSLNDDGDFVHYLVWESISIPDTYYFGFEDLFRGGDNDFEDMFFVAEGLVPPCDPQPEECNGEDDDCDGEIDEGLTRDCSSACGDGEEICTDGSWGDCDAPEPETEICDGVDNNCNGDVDEGLTQSCSSECGDGTAVCFFGDWVDCDAAEPDLEVCDNVDNDCDGDVDEDLSRSCASVCGPGIETCSSGSWVGCDAPLPESELCNGLDDDCDGEVDEFNPEGGSPCGTDVGECRMGVEECIAGELVCTGERGPIDEVCNGLDDDCDGEIDEDNPGGGAPCGSDVGACLPGILTCILGRFECEGSVGPQPEECNGIDDDCDGVIDDDLVRDCEAPCGPGNQICVDGEWGECLGPSGNPEVCNGRDDDCDGEIDEGFENPICPEEGSICVDGECALPCATGEFPCPPDKVCIDGFCVLGPCRDVECPEGQMCVGGECIDLCGSVQCSEGFVCNLGRCVENNCYGLGCEPGQICDGGECVSNPCAEVVCSDGEFCLEGECISSCAGVQCPDGQRCQAGSCVDDPCVSQWCPSDQVCIDGQCLSDPCEGLDCGTGRICLEGECVDDPCFHVTCPGDQMCIRGDCFDEEPPPPRRPDEYGMATGGGGFSCSTSATPPRSPWLGFLLILGVSMVLRRRRSLSRGPLLKLSILLLSAMVLLGSGCQVDPYCFTCDDGGADGDGDVDGDGDGDGDGGPPDGNVPDSCVYEGEEECDSRDNDCNGLIDEGFDTTSDPVNCGACGVICIIPHAFPMCVDGECYVERCDVGWVDFDNLPGNGCEYECLGSGSEVCDGVDNDCDTAIDEGFDLAADVNNCGSCGVTCAFYHAAATCVGGDCVMGDCEPGFEDIDGDPDTGCEYNCSPSGAGETCDGQDNDCDGSVDEGIDVDIDPSNCGACGRVCIFLNAAASCDDGDCVLGTCDAGWIDLDEVPENGCEYPCPGVSEEVCDGQDNDCNGLVDEADPDIGTACGSDTGDCTPGVWACRVGRLECEGGSTGLAEVCDGEDNDCDGVADNGNPGGGARCGSTNIGACEYGTVTCTGGALVCGGGLVESTDEVCNNVDDDCDGDADEGIAPRACSTDCGSGTERCSAGAWVDCSAPPELPDLCDRLDNDCNGTTDPGCPVMNADDIWVEDNASNTVFPSLAADGASRAVVAYLDRRSGSARIRLSGTANQATSWSSPSDIRIDSTDEDAMSPVVAMASGRAYIAWEDTTNGDERSIYFRRSLDGGATWESGETRLDVGLSSDSFDIDMAANGSDIYVVWQEMDWSDRSRAIYLASSSNGGSSFDAPVRVDHHPQPATGIAREPSVAAGPSGRVYVAFADNRHGPGAIFVNASDDGGDTWLPADVRVDPNWLEYESQHPVITADGEGNVVVAWEDEYLQGVDTKWKVYAAVSTDHGETFDDEQRLDDDPLPHDSRDPAIAVDPVGAYIYVTWRDMRNGLADIYLQRLDLSSTVWDDASTRVDSDEDGVGNSTLPRVAAGADGRVWVVWEDDRSGQRDIYLNFSLDWGEAFQPVDFRLDNDLPGDADSHDPRVVVTADRAVVVWVDHRAGSGTVGDIYARYME